MAKRLYMAGVADVDMFAGDELFATAKTLTESSISISTSAEDIRGGLGAALLGKYYHTSAFDLTLTDALFSLEYLAKSVGANIESGSDVTIDEQRPCETAGEITLTKTPVPFIECGKVYVYVREAKEDAEYERITLTAAQAAAKKVEKASFEVGKKYCVKYFYNNSAAKQIVVKSNYIPATFHIVLKVNLYYAGRNDANSTSTTRAGYLLIDIPRFQLDGSQDLSMSMTGASTTSLKGSALATEGCAEEACNSENFYATITEVLDGDNWTDDVVSLAVDGGDIYVDVPGDSSTTNTIDVGDHVYVIFKSGSPKRLSSITDADYEAEIVGGTVGGLTASGKNIVVANTYGGNGTVKITVTGIDQVLAAIEVVTNG